MIDREFHLDKRDQGIVAAHASISEAIVHLAIAVDHANAVNDQVYVNLLSNLVKWLSVIRQSLTQHIDWLETLK